MTEDSSPDTLLLVDSDPEERTLIRDHFAGQGYRVTEAANGSQARKQLRRNTHEVLLLDLSLPDSDGLGLIQLAREENPRAIVLVISDSGGESLAAKAFRSGADDLFQRPLRPNHIDRVIHRIQQRRAFLQEVGLVGNTPAMRRIYEIIEQIAPTDVTVMVVGESGTGKELVARALHLKSPRRNRPFLAVNCGALAEGVLDSELFGHEKGAFTGAISRRQGRFELANSGTLFLDEVSELPPTTQVRLLRVLEQQEFMRVGGTTPIKVDVRLIAATNRDLEEAVAEGQFREDLFYRLNVVVIHIPALRQRPDDIPLLIDHFIRQSHLDRKERFQGISPEAMEILKQYHWPGNVRELRNLIENLIVLAPDREIQPQDIPKYLRPRPSLGANLPARIEKTREQTEREIIYKTLLNLRAEVAALRELMTSGEYADPSSMEVKPRNGDWVEEKTESGEDEDREMVVFPVGTDMARVEREMIRKTLQHVGGNRKKAAQLLGIGERTLYRKIQMYGLNG
jgi:DNA-binding NtrC family response regulator